MLDGIDEKEKDLILTTVKLHGAKDLPEDLDDDERFYCKLVRDADKIDIFEVVTRYQAKYRDDPDKFPLEIEFPDEPTYSDEVYKKVYNGKTVDYRLLQVWNDMKLLQIGWVYDMNFATGLKRIKERGYLEKMFEFLPNDEKITELKKKIFSYLDERIEKNINL